MKFSRIRYFVFAAVLVSLSIIQNWSAMAPQEEKLECFMILAGKDSTSDGSILLAHNNDLTGEEASLMEKYPRRKHGPGSVVRFPTGLLIPQVGETAAWMVLKIYKGFAEGDAVAVNEYGVAIAGGVALGDDRNPEAAATDPLIKKGLTGGVRYIALQRSKTARECVEMIGSLYTKYGVTYPSGVGIADTGEIWYLESGGGRSWAAVRIPDDSVWVQANGYRIGVIDFEDKKNFLTSPGLRKFAVKKGLWKPGNGAFHFARIFGRKKRGVKNLFYNSRRVWRGISLIAPSMGLHPDTVEFPMFISPDRKVDLKTLFSILRDRYQGTCYNNEDERAISVNESVHTTVIQLRGWLYPEIGNVVWGGTGPSPYTPYIPFYFGVQNIPSSFTVGGKDPEPGSAFWKFRKLSDIADHPSVIRAWENIEGKILLRQPDLEESILKLYRTDKKKALRKLNEIISVYAEKAMRKAGEMLTALRKKADS